MLCEYAFELAGAFSTFYQGSSILHEEDVGRRGAWLGLTERTLTALETVLGLLGLSAPERM